MSSATEVILEGEHLSRVYKKGKKEVRALSGVDLRLSRGEFLIVAGPSGAGKSTLLHLIGALDTPTEGRVFIDGVDIYKVSEAKRAGMRNTKIGFVFQFYHLLPEFTALENVLLPAMISGRGAMDERRGTKTRAKALLESVGLAERVDHKPSELSGGESQRVAIARALINEPDILLCDEPTGNLDSKTGADVIDLLCGINREKRVSLVIATHDAALRERADRAMYIKDGRVSG